MNKYTTTKYVIRKKKEFGVYHEGNGEMCDSLKDAFLYGTYIDANNELSTFDEPTTFTIIRVYQTISEEEVMQ